MSRSEGINFKEKFGDIPKSCIKFKKSKELLELVEYDNNELSDVNDGVAKARGGGYAKNIKYSMYNPDQAKFIIEYYTNEDYLIFDPFMGRATRPLISNLLNRRYIGCDINKKTVDYNNDLLTKKFNSDKCILIHQDSINFISKSTHAEKYNNLIDCVFTCPPYYDIEKYGGEQGDLSHMQYDEYDKSMQSLFHDLYNMIKSSSYEKQEFYPVIFTVGTVRKGKNGLIDMDYKFQQFAYNAGFVLHDKLITENIAPGAGFTFRRNYDYFYTCKNHETTLVFLKYE